MPVRSSSSSVLKWPDTAQVRQALADWADATAAATPTLRKVGHFGSYARDDWGPGSDLDVVIVLDRSSRPFLERGMDWDLTGLPVPADALIYTDAEWRRVQENGGRFAEMLSEETFWVYERED